ncbi:AraC family transcriptional regulator [Pontibacter toksunensis]|uniref:AraC family transcriptional regulator n=1 Tax=Pontibacter toksunensis TaxID=1332631 RepID=A0ABW6C1Z2_9BACT
MKLPKADRLPIQDLLNHKALTVMPLETYASELSEVPHSHDAYMIMYVQETKGGDHLIDFQRYPLQADRVYLLRPGQAHQRESRQEKGVLVSFSEKFLQTTGMRSHDVFVIFSAVYQHPYLDLPEKLQVVFEALVKLMIQELQESKPDMEILSRYLYIILQYLLRECQVQLEKITPARHSERLFRLSSMIENHYREHCSTGFYADALGITPKHLNSLCRQYLHTTVADIQHDRLLVESKRLLFFSSLSVKEISYQLGFEDASYFVRFFKRMTGLTPTQLRTDAAQQV